MATTTKSTRGRWTPVLVAAALGPGLAWLFAPRYELVGATQWALMAGAAVLACAFAAPARSLRVLLLGGVALGSLCASVLAPRLFPLCAALLCAFAGTAAALGVERRVRRDAALAVALGVGCAALLLTALAVAGGADSRHAILGALRLGWSDPWTLALVGASLPLGAFGVFRLATRWQVAPDRALAWGFAALAALVVVARVIWIGSYASIPADLMVWSEPPFLLDLLKLRTGHVLYGPLQLVNAYPYAPLLQLLHHALLSPFRLDLSLAANRALALGWQLLAAVVLVWALGPRVVEPSGGRALSWLALVELSLAAFGSNFIAPYVHPDHALMLCFALAMAALLAEERMPRPLFVAILVVTPALATGFKLTGAGIGLGLVLAMLVERRWRELAWLALAALLALGVFPLFDHTLGAFSDYCLKLFASQPLRWHKLLAVPFTAAGRLALAAFVALAAARWRFGRQALLLVASRIAWLTLGFAVVSMPAFLKVGGRENDLLPLAIGAAVVLLLTATAFARRTASRAAAPAAALCTALVLVPPRQPCPASMRASVVKAEQTLEALVRSETRAGRRTLLYSSTLAWIRAGRRDVPRDRAQTAVELFAAGRLRASGHLEHLDRDYDSVIAVGAAFRHGGRWDKRFVALITRHLLSHYSLVRPHGASALPHDAMAVILLRRVQARRR